MTLDLAMIFLGVGMTPKPQETKEKEKRINRTSSRIKTFADQRTLLTE